MLQYVNYRMRITILDGRTLVGTLMAFDRHLNLVSFFFADDGKKKKNEKLLPLEQYYDFVILFVGFWFSVDVKDIQSIK